MKIDCFDCYWKSYGTDFCLYHDTKTDLVTCSDFRYECYECGRISEITVNKTHYCNACFLNFAGVDTYTVTHYMLNGECLGNEDEIEEIVDSVIEMCDFENLKKY